MSLKKMCVVIPVHKPVPSVDEVTSLLAASVHLQAYDRYLVYPEGMNIGKYIALDNSLQLMPVNKSWLASVESYNKMKVSANFYELFVDYQFMMTYELDAYIFHGNLEEANAFRFDYIGAPFFEGYWDAKPGAKFIKGGNSGFSVRNIASCINALKTISSKYKWHWRIYRLSLYYSSRLRRALNNATKGKYEVFITGRFAFNFQHFHLNEDVVWSEVVPQLVHSFTIADPLSALAFSFEYNLEESLKLNNGKLPLGCHAWAKHPEFWSEYIPAARVSMKGETNSV